MSKLYFPDTPALAFIVLMESNTAIEGTILFRKSCLDPTNAAVIVIQVDENSPVDPNLASKPEFFFKYDQVTDIGTSVTDALLEVAPYKVDGYKCKR